MFERDQDRPLHRFRLRVAQQHRTVGPQPPMSWRARPLRIGHWLSGLALACVGLALQAQTDAAAALRPAASAVGAVAKAPARPVASRAAASAPAAARPVTAASTPSAYTLAAPPAWVDVLALEAVPAELPRAPVQLVLIDRQTRLQPGGSQQYRRAVRQVNEPSGLEPAAQIEVEFDPGYQRLVLHSVAIVRGGQRIDKLETSRVKLLHREPQLERQMIDGRMTAALVLDDVRVGDRIDWAYSVIGDNPVFGGRFVDADWTLGSLGPAALYRYRLLAPAARNIRHQSGDVSVAVSSTLRGDERETLFVRRLTPVFRFDPTTPGDTYLKDQLQLSEFADWAEVARWAEQLFASAAQPGPAVLERAQALRAAHAEPAERLRAALDLVQTEVRYFGTEIGPNSHQPAAAEQVLRQRFGDCKDKVALLMALARALDLPAQPLLVSTRYLGAVQAMLPSPLAFDHAIAGVTLDGQLLWLDGTRAQQTGPAAGRQPVGLGYGLPARADATALVALPGTADALRVEAEDVFRVDQPMATGLTLEARETFYGDLAEMVRGARDSLSAADFNQQMAADHLRAYPGLVTDGGATLTELAGRNAVSVSQRYRWAEPWRFPQQRQLMLDFAMPTLMTALRLPDQNPRTLPLRIGWPGVYRQVLRFEFAEPVFAKPSSGQVDDKQQHFQLALRTEGGTTSQRIEAELRQTSDRIAPADWVRHRDALVKVWPRLNNTMTLSALSTAQAEALRGRFTALDDDLRRGRLKGSTAVQRDAQVRVMVLGEQLGSGRLSPKLRAEALTARGEQLDHLGRMAEAQADFQQALALSPGSAEVLGALAVNALLRRADDEAVGHASAALATAPSDMAPRYTRAYAHYFRQAWGPAQDDLGQILASRSEVERSYAQIWLYLANRRAGGDGLAAIAKHVPAASQPGWPFAVLQYIKGAGSFDQALVAARDDGKPDPGKLCELYFYAGQKAVLDGDLRLARQYLQKSLDTGVIEFNEYPMAQRELEALRGR